MSQRHNEKFQGRTHYLTDIKILKEVIELLEVVHFAELRRIKGMAKLA